MSEDDSGLLLLNQLVGSDQRIQGVIHRGQFALVRLKQHQTWQDWCAVIKALAKGRDICREVSRSHIASISTSIPLCTTIGHSRTDIPVFLRQRIEAQRPDGDPPSAERRMPIEMLPTGVIKVTCNCALISEGLKPAMATPRSCTPRSANKLNTRQLRRGNRSS
jgi:hypothetical protein